MKEAIVVIIISIIFYPGWSAENYTLYNVLSSTTTRLIDLNGNPVKSWTFTRTPSASTPWLILPDSIVLRAQTIPNPPLPGGGAGGHIQIVDWNGNIRWNYYFYGPNYIQHHDVHPMPNGNILLIAWERKTRAQAESLGRVNITGEMWPEMIVEVNPRNDSIVWEWHIWDHLIQDVDPSKPNYGVVRDHPELMDINFGILPPNNGDWMHTNTLDYNPELDQIIFSSHNTSEIYIIDHSTTTEQTRGHRGGNSNMGGDFLYRWGNPQAYRRGTSADQRLFVVHGVNWIDPGLPGEGHILMFNNGDRPYTNGDSSSVEEIIPPRTGYTYYRHPDSAFGPKLPCWMYSAGTSFFSNHLSGAFRLSSGNTFICEGTKGRLFEVTPSGQVIWSFNAGGQVQNAKRYDLSPTGVAEQKTENKQNQTTIKISPCPFSSSTQITCFIPHPQFLSIEIFNPTGQLVETVFKGWIQTGRRYFIIGDRLLPGVYFLKVSSNNMQKAIKFVKLKYQGGRR